MYRTGCSPFDVTNRSEFTEDMTPLILAAHNNDFNMIHLLMKHGHDINVPPKRKIHNRSIANYFCNSFSIHYSAPVNIVLCLYYITIHSLLFSDRKHTSVLVENVTYVTLYVVQWKLFCKSCL